ncbi:hypothetical protein MMC07_006007 [Pseudocyphellaria aurata]|nr:hypothetical protein [Pseudocyphellaria aurata]
MDRGRILFYRFLATFNTWSPLERAVLANDRFSLDHLISSDKTPPTAALDALHLSAQLSRPDVFSYLLHQHPRLTSSLASDEFLYAAVEGSSIPIWRIILSHKPSAKSHQFGHRGTLLEICVSGQKIELLSFLLQEGAKPGTRILIRAKLFGASGETEELLRSYGATIEPEDEGWEEEWKRIKLQRKEQRRRFELARKEEQQRFELART